MKERILLELYGDYELTNLVRVLKFDCENYFEGLYCENMVVILIDVELDCGLKINEELQSNMKHSLRDII